MKDQDLQEHASSALLSFAKLVESSSTDSRPQADALRLESRHRIAETNGWGRKYCDDIKLHGEEWFAALETAKPVIESGGIVVMAGNRGPGKTQMAAELAKIGKWPDDKGSFISSGNGCGATRYTKTAIYRRAMDIFLDLRDAAKNHSQTSEKQVLAKLEDCGLLVIDEFQERGETVWENRVMKNLMDKRYAAERPTIIIANLTRKELFAALGDSVLDRARENGKSIEFTWESYRKPQPK